MVRPVNPTFCIDADWLESAINLKFVPGADTVEELTKNIPREYFHSNAEASKLTATIESIDKIVEEDLKMKMSDRSAN